MTVKRLTEHLLEAISFKGGCTGLSESTIVKMPHCWKSHVTAQMFSQKVVNADNSLHFLCNKTDLHII